MKTINIVQAYYESFDEAWSIIVGTFSNKELAEKYKSKWETFYKEKQSTFNEPDDWEQSEYDYMYENESWRESEAYENLSMKYEEIQYFKEIRIVEVLLDKDLFKDTEYNRTTSMIDLITEWDRNYKLNEIIDVTD